jgi:hypothetical protein|tara:strand:- start:1301 stop:1939 length:639 start_codon:yes stop_codon:yes gene_type:complete
MGFFKKKEEKKKFDFSEDTKELFAERDSFYSEMRQKMGGEASNPEVSKNSNPEKPDDRKEDLDDLLGGGDFNPYVNKEESGMADSSNIPVAAPPAPSSSSAFSCQSCGKEFQEKWGKCPSCGGEMKKAEATPEAAPEAAPESVPTFTPTEPSTASSDLSSGDPLDDLLGDFGSGTTDNSSDDLGADFGSSKPSHSNRKVRKVKRVKRSRNQL